MQKVLLVVCLMVTTGIGYAQQIHEKIPATVNAEIHTPALESWDKIPALRQWLPTRNDGDDGTTANSTAASHVIFRWPMRAKPGLCCPGRCYF